MINSTGQNTKYPRYQDYVIKGGKFVGEFEEMYRDFSDPWEQTTREKWASEKALALHLIQKLKAGKVLELGCGLGHYTKKIADLGVETMGIDVSKTAIEKARSNCPDCNFVVGDILDFAIYRDFKPDIIVMAEITWYVLDKLDNFIEFLKTEMPNIYLIHLLTTYPDGVQKYGREKFTNLQQIMVYFGAQYMEWGEISYPEMEGCKRTYFVGQWRI
jgi:SAM-dependent methyltransferase